MVGWVFLCAVTQAQTNEWTWINGPQTPQLPVYGTLGTPAASNLPGNRELAASWTDANGNFWIFGGLGRDSTPVYGLLNDLWQYNPSTNEWTWMGGSSTTAGATGVYGSLGQPAPGNVPPGREGASTWIDAKGNFWLFGGADFYQSYNDLWEYTPTSNQWTWVSGADKGNQPGVYGALGTSATTNVPGARTNAASWIDSKGNFWLFGGDGLNSTQESGYLNDLWKFDPSMGQWTWMGGSSTPCSDCGQPGIYGQQGVPATTNIPGGRYAASWWVDKQGKFWLFGGSAVDSVGKEGLLNDLWKFDPSTGQWTWISGSETYPQTCSSGSNGCGAPGVYGTLQKANATNYPGPRSRGVTWVDSTGNVWLFGGSGNDSAGTWGYLNDLWRYDPSTNQWAWMSGNNTVVCASTFCGQPGVYGSLQTPAFGNTPSGRNNATAWTDSKGDLWLFGGTGNDVTETWGYFQDIWEFQPNTNGQTVTATPTFSPVPGSDTSPQTVTIEDATPASTIYYIVDGNVPASQYTAPIPVSTSETITAIAVASGYANSDVATGTYTVSAVPAAAPAFNPASGNYQTAQTVSLSDATPGAAIYYTTDGTLPTSNSAVYQGPITVSSSQVVQAIAVVPGLPDSAVASAVYTIASTATSGLGEWTWMGGSLQNEHAGVYGTIGVPAAGNVPGARQNAASWKDASGNLWLFGGAGFDGAGATGFLNDLWKYNPSTQQWAWIAGSKTVPCSVNTQVLYCGGQAGVYGTLGSPSPANMPGGRLGAAAWTDSGGHLWLFGGYGTNARGQLAELNDLWEFDPAAAVWTWMGGSSTSALSFYSTLGQPGVYGTLGVPAATNIPGSRYSAATWVDGNGNFWLFGGTGQDADGLSAQLNDLWMFNLSTRQWVWMGGSNVVPVLLGYQEGAYGTLGVPDEGNIPGSRSSAAAWTDSSGNLWLFGGTSGEGIGALNDLWKYDPSSHLWAWMAGTGNSPHPEVRGTLGIPAAANTPGAGNVSANWTDPQGNLWLLGGDNTSITGAGLDSYLGPANELWVYNPSINEWAWMGGEYPGNCQVTVSVYSYPVCNGPQGISLGVPAGGQVPVARSGAVSWTDNKGIFWLFSGGGPASEGATDFPHYINDLWQYQPSLATLPAAAPPIFSSQSVIYQPGGKVTLANGMANATFYYTTDGSTPTTASNLYGGPVTIASSETVKAMATAPGYDNSIVTSTTYTVVPAPAMPVFSVAPGTYTSIQTVTITDATLNVTIYYTTDGSTPTAISPVYTAPIAVSSSETLNAVAVTYVLGSTAPGTPFASDALPSAMATAAYIIHLPPAAAPTFSVPAGTYTSIQTVTISDTTAGATIYYTTNGALPTTSSSVYNGPITVSATETITAIAVATGYVNSTPAVAQYTINFPPAATPTFSVPAGTYTSPQTVVISDATAGATIYYTTSDFPQAEFIYTRPLVVSASITITAYASAPDYKYSATAKAQYTINLPPAATPAFSVPAGIYTSPQTVTITDAIVGANIYYFVNKGAVVAYTAPIQVSTSETITAFAAAQGYANSAPATAAYTIQPPPAATPAFSTPPGTYTSPQTLTMSDATTGARIYYTTDGSTPSTSSTLYSGPISVAASETIAAIAVAAGYSSSAVATAAYTINLLPAATPSLSVPAGTYTSPQTVTISDATAGARIYYTTDGSTPSAGSTLYAGPISVSTTQTLAAIAVAAGYANSAIASAQYTVTASGPAFTIAPSTTSVTLAAGQSASVSISLTPLNGFNAAVSFSCSGLPVGASCSFSPATVTPSGGPVSTTVTITAPSSKSALPAGPGPLVPPSVLVLSLGGFWWKKRRRWLSVSMFVACVVGLSMLNGCGGGASTSAPANTNPPVTSAVTVTATAGSLQYTTTLSLTINGQ
jgi:N-acetylneuraminic acid mutarotase